MTIKSFPILPALALILAGCGAPETTETPKPVPEEDVTAKARAIHDEVIALDTHVDIPFDYATEKVDPGVRGDAQVDLPKMEEGGLDAAFFIVYVGQTERTREGYEKAKADAMTKFDAIHRMTETMYPDRIELARTADDVVRIHEAGKLAACIGIENGFVIGKDLSLLSKYHELGARYVTLAHNGHNDIADSANPRTDLGDRESEHDGVSEFGKEVIAEMNRLGIMVDVSHISKKAMLDAVALSKAPVIGSHSSTRALADVPRNMDDEQLRALKANGGVMQTVALGAFVKNPPEKQAATKALQEEFGLSAPGRLSSLSAEDRARFEARQAEIDQKWPKATVTDFVDHIDHAVEVMGIDHVGISSDFDGGGGIVGWNNAAETGNVTLELVRRGYTEEEIAKLWSGNLLRVWRDVERVAKELQGGAAATGAPGR
jgi:membrane dipeptidase